MRDLDKLTTLLTGWGVPYSAQDNWKDYTIQPDGNIAVVVNEDNCVPTIKGYGGFFTKFVFDPKGKFVSMGAWE